MTTREKTRSLSTIMDINSVCRLLTARVMRRCWMLE